MRFGASSTFQVRSVTADLLFTQRVTEWTLYIFMTTDSIFSLCQKESKQQHSDADADDMFMTCLLSVYTEVAVR